MNKRELKPGIRIIKKRDYTGTYSDHLRTWLVLSVDKEHNMIWVADCTLSIFKTSCVSMARYKVISEIETENWNKIIGGKT